MCYGLRWPVYILKETLIYYEVHINLQQERIALLNIYQNTYELL